MGFYNVNERRNKKMSVKTMEIILTIGMSIMTGIAFTLPLWMILYIEYKESKNREENDK